MSTCPTTSSSPPSAGEGVGGWEGERLSLSTRAWRYNDPHPHPLFVTQNDPFSLHCNIMLCICIYASESAEILTYLYSWQGSGVPLGFTAQLEAPHLTSLCIQRYICIFLSSDIYPQRLLLILYLHDEKDSPIEPLQHLPQQLLISPTGARLVLCNQDAGYPGSGSPGRGVDTKNSSDIARLEARGHGLLVPEEYKLHVGGSYEANSRWYSRCYCWSWPSRYVDVSVGALQPLGIWLRPVWHATTVAYLFHCQEEFFCKMF